MVEAGAGAESRPPNVSSVSVVIPCRNERAYIESCVDSMLRQAAVPDCYEILVADGESDDGTTEVVLRIAASNPRVRLIANPGRIVPTGLNAAIRNAVGEVIIRIDAHTEYADDYVAQCLATLLQTGAANVGGAARTRSTGYFQTANSVAYHSPFAVGGARFHDPDYEGYVDTVPYGCWRKSYLMSIGLFDEEFVRNQDDELNLRTTRAGGRIWQSRSILSWYRPRSSAGALFRQYFQYGYWKVMVLRKHRIPASIRHLVPVSALAIMVILASLAPFVSVAAQVFLLLAATYLGLSLAASVVAAAKARRWRILPILPAVFALYHGGYALGFATALFDVSMRRSAVRSSARQITR